MQLSTELIFIILCLLWLSAISFYIFRSKKQYEVFTEGSDLKTLPSVLESIARSLSENKKAVEDVSSHIDLLTKEQKLSIQKIGLLRFNPFRDTGGDQSFVLSLIDANDTGVVISALYSRSGTRWYAKKVINGKGQEYELSDEEQKAIKLAKNLKKT